MTPKQQLIDALVTATESCDFGALRARITEVLDNYYVEPDITKALSDKKGDQTLTAFSSQLGCTPSYVSDVMNGHRSPGPKIWNAIGVEKPKRKWR